jgi:hypothetical protein
LNVSLAWQRRARGVLHCTLATLKWRAAHPPMRQLDRSMVFEKGHDRPDRPRTILPLSPWPAPPSVLAVHMPTALRTQHGAGWLG